MDICPSVMYKGYSYFYYAINGYLYRTDKGADTFDFIYELAKNDGCLYIDKSQADNFMLCIVKPFENLINFKLDDSLEAIKLDTLEATLYLDIKNSSTLTARLDFIYNNFHLESNNRDYCFIDGEDEIYNFLFESLKNISDVCEIFMTDAVRNFINLKKFSVKINVHMDNGLLNLDTDISGINLSELTDVLSAYREHKKFYRLKDGSFVKLENSVLGELSDLYAGAGISPKDITNEQMKIPAYRALYLDRFIKENRNISFCRDKVFKDFAKTVQEYDDSDFEIPKNINGTLRGYQESGCKWLKAMSSCELGGILADDMGLGKTLQIITLFVSEKNTNSDYKTSLVVCPASLVMNWEEEIHKFAPSLNCICITGTTGARKALIQQSTQYDVVITSYDLLKRDIKEYTELDFLYEIIDEAQYIKNYNTHNTKAVKCIKAHHHFALTGTPIKNGLEELWSVFDYLMPGYLHTISEFNKKYTYPIVKNNDEECLSMLKKMISPFIIRRMKKDVLTELPDKTEVNIPVVMDKKQKKLYSAYALELKKSLEGSLSPQDKIKVLAAITRLRQLCCDPSLVYENYTGGSAKLESCTDLIESCVSSGHKLLLFSQFTSMLDIISKQLETKNIEYYTIQGSTPKKKRIELVNKFNTDTVHVFLISLKAGGTGLNLTGADIVIHYDPWWNVSAQNQATDRVYRIGQEKNVTVYKLITSGTIEEKVVKMQENKSKIADAVIEVNENSFKAMSTKDILNLIE